MYFVDRDKINEILLFLENQIALFEKTEEWETPIKQAALQRITQTIIEAIIDVGNSMIDGFIMRDPGSYEDIVVILEDEKVIEHSMSEALKQIIQFRKVLVQSYLNIPHDHLIKEFTRQLPFLKQFSLKINHYLQDELGPVSAFKK
ncbi:type VII toxin-antitoxin system HepT family RNase toxin [Bacillus sp. 03113]|uniref:type VII toxin-antitoxin system HepT family RNase toxin n=1 Tax=Bacillus sp. 03113 TaxID=2578211 RepID=UPI0011448DCA|nr:DUF86 domain-containing protein [Bacillus sp. 03113]